MGLIACTRDCYDTCVFEPIAAGGRLVDLRPARWFPVLGFTCPRGRADVKRLYSERRVKRPLLRSGGSFIEVGWDRAIAELAERLRSADPRRVIHVEYDGNQGLLTWYYPARLFNALGAASTDYSICSAEGHAALKLHWGRSWGMLPEELASARAVVFWGVNAAVSFIHGWALAKRARATIAAVDVALTETLKAADLPVVVRPGTDVVLALGIARELISRGSYDRHFVERYSYGFEKFAEYVQRFDPQYVEAEAGVDPQTLKKLADLYESGAKTVIGFSLGRTLNGGEAVRAISLIHGLLGDPLGFFYSNSGAWGIDFDYLRGLHAGGPSSVVPMGLLGNAVDKFDVMYVWNSNPVMTLPQGDRICEAARRGDLFLAIHDLVLNETAECADLVLPAPSYLEKDDVVYSYWHNLLVYNRAVAQPVGESRPEHWVVREVAKALGLGRHVLMAEDPWDAVDRALRPAGVSLAELRARGVVVLRRGDPMRFNTPSGKLEFYSTSAERRGASPLPAYVRPAAGYVLTFTSEPLHTNTQFFEEYGAPPPVVYVNPEDLKGDYACLERGGVSIKVRLVADPAVPRGVLLMRGIPRDAEGRPVNAVVDGTPNPYGGTPRINTTVVDLRPC
ncbi:MAG: molybdopterin-dependent oxidoreductase [Thermoproteus sp.]